MKNLLIIALTLLMACQQSNNTQQIEPPTYLDEVTLSPAQQQSFGIVVGSQSKRQINETIKINGSVQAPPQAIASVSFAFQGVIKEVLAMVGMPVHKGQVLATIQSIELIQLQQDYAQAINQLQLQAYELTRQRTLNNEDLGAKKRLQEAESAYQNTNVLCNALAIKLKMTGLDPTEIQKGNISAEIPLRSPIAGIVKAIHVNKGSTFTNTEELFQVMNTLHQFLVFKVFEKDAFKIKVGQSFELENPINEGIEGNITIVGSSFEGNDRTVGVQGKLAGNTRALKVGQYVTALLKLQERIVNVLPEGAVVREGEYASVFVRKDNQTFKKIAVKIGIEQEGYVELLTPLPQQGIVIKGAKLLAAEINKNTEPEE